MNGDENDIVFAEDLADSVDAAAAFGKWDVFLLRNYDAGIKSELEKSGVEAGCYLAIETAFKEAAVRAAFARGIVIVAGVKKDCHRAAWFWCCSQIPTAKLRNFLADFCFYPEIKSIGDFLDLLHLPGTA